MEEFQEPTETVTRNVQSLDVQHRTHGTTTEEEYIDHVAELITLVSTKLSQQDVQGEEAGKLKIEDHDRVIITVTTESEGRLESVSSQSLSSSESNSSSSSRKSLSVGRSRSRGSPTRPRQSSRYSPKKKRSMSSDTTETPFSVKKRRKIEIKQRAEKARKAIKQASIKQMLPKKREAAVKSSVDRKGRVTRIVKQGTLMSNSIDVKKLNELDIDYLNLLEQGESIDIRAKLKQMEEQKDNIITPNLVEVLQKQNSSDKPPPDKHHRRSSQLQGFESRRSSKLFRFGKQFIEKLDNQITERRFEDSDDIPTNEMTLKQRVQMINTHIKEMKEREEDSSKGSNQKLHKKRSSGELLMVQIKQKVEEGLRPGSVLLPKKYLELSGDQWKKIEEVISQERKDQIQRLNDIKFKIFGEKQMTKNDISKLMMDFAHMYQKLYTKNSKFMKKCCKKVEKAFHQLSPRQQEKFDVQKAFFLASHEKDEFQPTNDHHHTTKKDDIEQDYEYALKFRKEYYKKVMRIARIWNVQLMTEEELPKHRKNVMKCEDNNRAFIDLKKRMFFQNLDMAKVDAKHRFDIIRRTLVTLDKCHKQAWEFLRVNWPKMQETMDANENMMDSEDDSIWNNRNRKAAQYEEEGFNQRQKRTILDGIQHSKYTTNKEIWGNPKVKKFIDINSTEGKLRMKNERAQKIKEMYRNKIKQAREGENQMGPRKKATNWFIVTNRRYRPTKYKEQMQKVVIIPTIRQSERGGSPNFGRFSPGKVRKDSNEAAPAGSRLSSHSPPQPNPLSVSTNFVLPLALTSQTNPVSVRNSMPNSIHQEARNPSAPISNKNFHFGKATFQNTTAQPRQQNKDLFQPKPYLQLELPGSIQGEGKDTARLMNLSDLHNDNESATNVTSLDLSPSRLQHGIEQADKRAIMKTALDNQRKQVDRVKTNKMNTFLDYNPMSEPIDPYAGSMYRNQVGSNNLNTITNDILSQPFSGLQHKKSLKQQKDEEFQKIYEQKRNHIRGTIKDIQNTQSKFKDVRKGGVRGTLDAKNSQALLKETTEDDVPKSPEIRPMTNQQPSRQIVMMNRKMNQSIDCGGTKKPSQKVRKWTQMRESSLNKALSSMQESHHERAPHLYQENQRKNLSFRKTPIQLKRKLEAEVPKFSEGRNTNLRQSLQLDLNPKKKQSFMKSLITTQQQQRPGSPSSNTTLTSPNQQQISNLKADKKKLYSLIYSCQQVQNEDDLFTNMSAKGGRLNSQMSKYSLVFENQLARNERDHTSEFEELKKNIGLFDNFDKLQRNKQKFSKHINKVTFKSFNLAKAPNGPSESVLRTLTSKTGEFKSGLPKPEGRGPLSPRDRKLTQADIFPILTPPSEKVRFQNKTQRIKQGVLFSKIEMGKHLEQLRLESLDNMYQTLKQFDEFDDPKFVNHLYRYNENYLHEYERMTDEVTKEYKAGILDPSRTVGRAERKRGAVRKQIESMKRKFARISK